MKILGMGVPELVIILAVILLIFGPKNLPKLGAALGSSVKSLREGLGADKKLAAEDEAAEDAADLIEELEDEEAPAPAPKKRVVRAKTPA